MKIEVRKPTPRELRGLKHAANLAECAADEMVYEKERGRQREAKAIFAGLNWLDKVLASIGGKP